MFGATYTSTLRSMRAFSTSDTRPRKVILDTIRSGTPSRISSVSPGPATSNRSAGRSSTRRANALSSTANPLRGSVNRPRKPIAPPSPGQSGSGTASAKRPTDTPFGITQASPPRCSTCTLRASALTAMRAVIFSSTERSSSTRAPFSSRLAFLPSSLAVWRTTR